MNRPPGDNLPAYVTSIDPIGGPQGPYFENVFETSFKETTISWSQICNHNPHVWIDDEKRVDFIDMFGSLNNRVTEQELRDYIYRISHDMPVNSKHSKNNDDVEACIKHAQMHESPYKHLTFSKIFPTNLVSDIQQVHDNMTINESDEKDNDYRFVYTAKKDDYAKNSTITSVIDTLINKHTLTYYNKEFFANSDVDILHPDTLHAIYFGINYTGYQTPAHIDNNKLLTMLIFFPDDSAEGLGTEMLDTNKKLVKRVPYETNTGYIFPCHHNTSPTYHSFTKAIPNRRRTIMYNVFKNEHDYITSYDTGSSRDIRMRAMLKREIPTHLFRTSELLSYRFDWTDKRTLDHRKNTPFMTRFNKNQGGINYSSMSSDIIDELLIDNNLPTTGSFFDRVERLKIQRSHMTELAEKTWNSDQPGNYLKTQGSG